MHDVIVIGSGQAGVPLATRLARAGKKVLLVERGPPGGTCVNYGCTPTKTMVASARAAHVARTAARLGVTVGEVKVDLAAVVARKDAIVQQWRDGLHKKIQKTGERLRFVQGHARLAGERTVEVNGERFQGDSVIINVGCRPVVPNVPGLDSVGFLDNRTVMELRAIPRRLLVLGGGYIGCEFGQMFRRFGAEVTVIDRGDHLLAREDPEVSSELEAVFRQEGIVLEQRAVVERVTREGEEIRVALRGGKTVSGSHLLAAVGREPNTADLGCQAAGVKMDERGFIPVDDDFRTSAPGVYAVGDVTGGPQFTHTSWDDHRLLYERLMGRTAHGRNGRVIPYTVFTDPQVAGVGLTEREAKAKGIDYQLASMPFRYIARAIELDEQAGVLRLLIDPKTEKVLGAFIVGAEAGELIHIFVTLMQADAPVRAIVDMEAVHPTFAEGVQSLVMTLERYALT